MFYIVCVAYQYRAEDFASDGPNLRSDLLRLVYDACVDHSLLVALKG
jgi:hypothetical protein